MSNPPENPSNDETAFGEQPTGPRIQGYALKEELHRGGQGVIYRAIQLGTKREVALKVLLEGPFAGESTRLRFEREVELAAALRHPNIVTILDSGLSMGRYYFAMELIRGERLDRYLARHRLPLEQTLELFARISETVNFAHQRGVLHRDLKPPNILVDAEGEPHVLDFGLAKPLHQLAGRESTMQVLSTQGQLLGTVAYMSPEQAAGSHDVDVRTDVYSLGVIFYEAVVGAPPYPVTGPLGEILNRIAKDEPLSPRGRQARHPGGYPVDDELATILLKALDKDPGRRYQTAGDLGRDFRHLLEGAPIEAKRASGLYMLKKTLRRYRLPALTAGMILMMLVGFLITFAFLFKSERAARELADEQAQETTAALRARDGALAEAQRRHAEALRAQEGLRRALMRQHINRADLALARSDLVEARNSYWNAYDVVAGPASVWALRRYYTETPDAGALLLDCGGRATAAVSPDGDLAAVCTAADAIAVRELGTGRTVSWCQTPGPVERLNVADDGALAAVGSGWAHGWEPGASAPSVAVQLPRGFEAIAIFPDDQGRALLLVTDQYVAYFRGAWGEVARTQLLSGPPTGQMGWSARLHYLAVPTPTGVELVRVERDGLDVETIWSAQQAPPRAVRFDGNRYLAVLADVIYISAVTDLGRDRWRGVAQVAADWELFDYRHSSRTVALATRDGRLALYRGTGMESEWRSDIEPIVDVRLPGNDTLLVSLDGHGELTTWLNPARTQQRRRIFTGTASNWAVSAEGELILLAEEDGRVSAYWPEPQMHLETLVKPRLFGFQAVPLSLAAAADGHRVAIRDGNTLRLIELSRTGNHVDASTQTDVWRSATYPRLTDVALSADGRRVARLAQSRAGGQDYISFLDWGEELRPSAGCPAVKFAGAAIREMLFTPQTNRLLVVRSNGQLFLHTPSSAPGEVGLDATPQQPWLILEAPPTVVAVSRGEEWLAVASTDEAVRLVDMTSGQVVRRILVGGQVTALAFNPHDDVLLIRTEDGTLRLHHPVNGELLVEWRLPAHQPLAAWIGSSDSLLVGGDDGVYEHRFQFADALLQRNLRYARQREIARLLEEGDIGGAWRATGELERLAPEFGRNARYAVMASALRRPQMEIKPAWLNAVLADANATALLRLGHAAYEGERFDLALDWLMRGRAESVGAVSSLTTWRAAECAYLTGDYKVALTLLDAAIARPDFDPRLAPLAALERVAALLRDGQPDAARDAVAQVSMADTHGRPGDAVAAAAARVIARFITGMESQQFFETGFESLLTSTFAERSLDFHDDVHFFAGELAELEGEPSEAAVHYQRCIDTARDVWPANWSRYRLRQLTDDLQVGADAGDGHAEAAGQSGTQARKG